MLKFVFQQSFFNKKIFLLCVFGAVFVVLTVLLLPIGIQKDGDSDTYTYLISREDGLWGSITHPQRPIVYPLFLYSINLLFGTISFSFLLLLAQFVILSLIFVFTYLTLREITSSRSVAFLGVAAGIFNYEIVRYVNYQNPEILLIFFLALFFYLVSRDSKLQKKSTPVYLAILLAILTFTKPIFIYYPMAILFYLGWLLKNKCISLSVVSRFFRSLLVFYVLPILLWSYGNFTNYGAFSFSSIQSFNLLGKVIRYDLADKGPEEVDGFKVKQDLKDIKGSVYERLAVLYNKYPEENQELESALMKFGYMTVAANFGEYIKGSVGEIPKFMSDYFLVRDSYCVTAKNAYFNSNGEVFRNWLFLACNYFPLKIYHKIGGFLYYGTVGRYFYLFIFLSMLVLIRSVLRKEKDRHFLLFLVLLAGYLVMAISLAGYESFVRLRLPLDYGLLILYMLSINKAFRIARAVLRR